MDGQYFEFGLADALGSVRAEIAALKAREEGVRRAILVSPVRETGREFDVFVRRSTQRRINKDALPAAILNDPRYWTERRTETVITRSKTGLGDATTPVGRHNTAGDDSFEVIEPLV